DRGLLGHAVDARDPAAADRPPGADTVGTGLLRPATPRGVGGRVRPGRSRTLSLFIARLTCVFAVSGLTTSFSAISALDRPAATSRTTSRSRSVSRSASGLRAAAGATRSAVAVYFAI